MPIFGKLAYDAGVSPGALLIVRFVLAAALLSAVLAVRPELRARPSTATSTSGPTLRRLVLTALGLGAIGYALQASLYFAALERLDAPLVAMVLYTYPALVTLTAAVLGREGLTPRRIGALAVSSVGTLMVLLGGGGASFALVGVMLAFGAAVTYTVYILVSDAVVHRLPPVVLATLVMAGAAVSLVIRGLVTGGLDFGFGWTGWLWGASIAVVSTVVAMLAFFGGLRRTGPSTAAILSTFEPVVTTVLAALVLQEFLSSVQLVGALVVLSSIVVLQLRPRRELPRASQLRPANEPVGAAK
jgi:drug/metabolite transporter (DMT)-like permease